MYPPLMGSSINNGGGASFSAWVEGRAYISGSGRSQSLFLVAADVEGRSTAAVGLSGGRPSIELALCKPIKVRLGAIGSSSRIEGALLEFLCDSEGAGSTDCGRPIGFLVAALGANEGV
jgi:hypothetical protein